MRHILMLSSGLGSWGCGRRLRDRSPPIPLECLFTDTLIEDADNYRFLAQGAADLLGIPEFSLRHLVPLWQGIPPLDRPRERAAHLAHLAREAEQALPGLHWKMDGRTPWEVFKDERFLGNTRAAPCSHILKQDVARHWLEAHCDAATTTLYLGIDHAEEHRLTGKDGKPGAAQMWLPWRVEAPLCTPPYLSKLDVMQQAERQGLEPPSLYDDGFVHSNCSGGCVRAGRRQFQQLLALRPVAFQHWEDNEEEVRQFLKKNVAILRDRRGGTTKPLPLRVLRQMAAAGERCTAEPADGGCGCFLNPPEEES